MPMRNFDGVQWETIRKRVDPLIADLNDWLDDCYYNHWKKGLSKSFYQWDVIGDPDRDKLQFDLLHGALHHIRTIILYKINELDHDYDTEEMFATYNDDGTVADPIGQVNQARAWLQDFTQQYSVDWSNVKSDFKQRVKDALNRDIVVD